MKGVIAILKAFKETKMGQKNIKQIIIYNRTDCCANRLSNYQVSISNKADFSTHIYQQDCAEVCFIRNTNLVVA
jgi:hypothetical protein